MKRFFSLISIILILFLAVISCGEKKQKVNEPDNISEMEKLVKNYAEVELTADINKLTANELEILRILIDVADIMD